MSVNLTREIFQAVVQSVATILNNEYIYPETAAKMADHIQAKLNDYDAAADVYAFADALTSDLQAISKDKHLRVGYDPEQETHLLNRPAEFEPTDEELAVFRAYWGYRNHGFDRVERLTGNIGYIQMSNFAEAGAGGETAVAAMNFVANCDAVIFDLRNNGGGFPNMVQLITSYLYDKLEKHLNTFYHRPTDESRQFWTFPYVPGRRLANVPVYVLTSGRTFSGAEEFTYNLKNMERATIVGQTTGGGAHPVSGKAVGNGFIMMLPNSQAINPITKTNWEGTGIEPHIVTAPEDALRVAHTHALEQIRQKTADAKRLKLLEWDMATITARYTPVRVDEAVLSRCVGQYGNRTIALENGILFHSTSRFAHRWGLTPLSNMLFAQDDDVRIEFIADAQGNVTALSVRSRDGDDVLTVARDGT